VFFRDLSSISTRSLEEKGSILEAERLGFHVDSRPHERPKESMAKIDHPFKKLLKIYFAFTTLHILSCTPLL
jgi:hypothetical protein